jgi:tRNA(His) 5'-end guanylyltransferase
MKYKDEFGDRIKGYEKVFDHTLVSRLPIIIRLDGNSFSKFTKPYKRPYDERITQAMTDSTTAVLNYCSGSIIGYHQSDEITVLLRNDQTLDTSPFLSNRIQKICSLVASTCSVAFNKSLGTDNAVFDCRVFVVNKEEVNNVFLWRQQDCWKNCVSAVAHWGLKDKYGRKTSQKMLDGQGASDRQEIIFKELGLNMNDYPTKYKRGICVVKKKFETPIEDILSPEKVKKLGKEGEIVVRRLWTPDYEVPMFNKNPEYIESLL